MQQFAMRLKDSGDTIQRHYIRKKLFKSTVCMITEAISRDLRREIYRDKRGRRKKKKRNHLKIADIKRL